MILPRLSQEGPQILTLPNRQRLLRKPYGALLKARACSVAFFYSLDASQSRLDLIAAMAKDTYPT